MIEQVFAVSKEAPERSMLEVLSKLMEEVGELSQEVGVEVGYQKRAPGKDGILGEVADVIIVALDILYLKYPDMDKKLFESVVQSKLNKWKAYL